MKWFKHDSDTTQDAKIKKLLMKYGVVGYGMYFHCLELIMGDLGENNITFELEHDAEIIADNLRIQGTADKAGVDIVAEIMRYMVHLGLFEVIDNRIRCIKLLKRIDTSMTSNTNFRNMITTAKAIHGMTLPEPGEQKVMTQSCKTRLDETRQEEREHARHKNTNAPMNATTYAKLVDDYGQDTVDSYFQRVADYCASKGKRYKDHAAAVRRWMDTDGVAKRKKPKTCPKCGVQRLGTMGYCHECGTVFDD